MPLGHDLTQDDQVAPHQEPLGLPDPGAFGDDVAGPTPQHRIAQLAQVAELAQPEGTAEHVRGPVALGPAGGVRGVDQEARRLAVHDDERGLVGHGHRPRLERVEVDVQRMARRGGGDGDRIEQPDVGAGQALGLLARARQRQGVRRVAEREEEGHREGRAGGQSGADGERAGDRHGAAGRGRLQSQEAGRQERVRRDRGGVTQKDLEGLVRELVRVDADEEAVGPGREGDVGGQVDGHGQRDAVVVVGVVADDGDASGARAVGTGTAWSSLTVPGGPGHDPAMAERSGPLSGIKIIELAGIGPGPFTCMMLADAGAQVLRLERAAPGAVERADEAATSGAPGYWDFLNRSRPSVGIDLKNPDAVELVLGLVEESDGLVEGFRPGVAERLGLGPDVCLTRNPRFVYGRMTGWGQDGPMASMAGHDIDYISIGGALWSHGPGRLGARCRR